MILSIETSTTVCSTALHDEGKLLSLEITHVPNSAASELAVMIDRLMKRHPEKLDAVAVSSGPGSYTGLRIGVATAKGICYALSVPLLSINTLALLAHQLRYSSLDIRDSLLSPMIDARRMEVYTTLFDEDLKVLSPTEAKVIDESSFADKLEHNKIIFFGNGADKCKSTITHPGARFIDNIFPSAAGMGELAYDSFRSSKFEDVAGFEPLYLKDFVAKKPKSLV